LVGRAQKFVLFKALESSLTHGMIEPSRKRRGVKEDKPLIQFLEWF
jgi:hypothetical protein